MAVLGKESLPTGATPTPVAPPRLLVPVKHAAIVRAHLWQSRLGRLPLYGTPSELAFVPSRAPGPTGSWRLLRSLGVLRLLLLNCHDRVTLWCRVGGVYA